MTTYKTEMFPPVPTLLTAQAALALLALPSYAVAASLDGIQNALSDGTDKGDITRVALTVGALILLGAVLVILRHYRERRGQLAPLGWIDSPKQIQQILRNAVHYRSTFELQFQHPDSQRRPILRCSPDNVTSAELILEAEGIKNIAHNWTDRPVNCYFKINVKGQHIYYAFATLIKHVETKQQTRCRLILNLPDRLENRQKRAFLRITPPREYMLGAAVWLGPDMPGLEDLPYMKRWPRPTLVLLPGKDKEQFTISDISAGGVRLTIPRKEMLLAGFELGLAENIVMILDLLNPDDRGRMRFWLHCRVQNLAPSYDTHHIEIGLQFLAWASHREDQSELVWFKLNHDPEVYMLGNWIIRRHLELFREDNQAGDNLYTI